MSTPRSGLSSQPADEAKIKKRNSNAKRIETRRKARRTPARYAKQEDRNAALAAAAAKPEISPLEFLLGIVRDPNVTPECRIKVALATLPFAHAKPGSALEQRNAIVAARDCLAVDDARAGAQGQSTHQGGSGARPRS